MTITKEDVVVLKDVLDAWMRLSTSEPPESLQYQTDHLHYEYDAGEALLAKLAFMAQEGTPS